MDGTDVAIALDELRTAEQEYAQAKKKVSLMKKRLAQALISRPWTSQIGEQSNG